MFGNLSEFQQGVLYTKYRVSRFSPTREGEREREGGLYKNEVFNDHIWHLLTHKLNLHAYKVLTIE